MQWQIFRTIFLDGRDARPLYLVGDPKQAIYGFRGADVSTYDERAPAPWPRLGEAHHLTRNFRSTPAVIDAYNAIFDQTARGAVLLPTATSAMTRTAVTSGATAAPSRSTGAAAHHAAAA